MSDSNKDDEDLVKYVFDLVQRYPDIDDIFQELRKIFLLKAWCVDPRCCLLLSSEVESLLDQNVINSNKFHLSFLESIFKHFGTNKKNAVLRSHDYVDDLKALSDRPMKEHSGFVANGSILEKKRMSELQGHT